jgi:hypothetical protein
MRVQNLNIGEAIYSVLASTAAVTAKVGQRIFPLVAPEGTQFPYVVYSCMSMSAARDKDSFFYQQLVTEGIVVCTDEYKEGVDIAMAILEALQFDDREIAVGDGTLSVLESRFDTRTEDYVNNVFVQGLTFNLKLR